MIPHFLLTLSALLVTVKIIGHSPLDWFHSIAPLIIAILIQTMVNIVQRHLHRIAMKRADDKIAQMRKASEGLFRSLGARVIHPDDNCDS
jgi:chromate transport protein ChrA